MVTANLPEAYRLMHQGALALSKVESVGIRMDVPYLHACSTQLRGQIKELNGLLLGSELGKAWTKYCATKGSKVNTESNPQLCDVLFGVMGIPPKKTTATGRPSSDQESINLIIPDVPDLELVLKLRKLRKTKGTYIDALLRETNSDGYLRPFFNLSTTQTYRSSSEAPNFQNQPIRDPEQGAIVRKAFRPRPGHRLVERDYGGIEVCIAACYNHDENLISYILDSTKDMHRDMAAECFKLHPDQVTKPIRQVGKNSFVFPQFYGDYYVQCAQYMWSDAVDLVTKDGTPLPQHMDEKRLGNPMLFERHIEQVEKRFWNQRFRQYRDWKARVWEQYKQTGYVNMYTGFRCGGIMTRNELINRPIQGSAFHCLLWSLVMIQRLADRQSWSSPIIGQIHDSMIQDVAEDEHERVHRTSVRVMTKEIRDVWPWIIVPLTVETKVSEVDGNWFEMEEV